MAFLRLLETLLLLAAALLAVRRAHPSTKPQLGRMAWIALLLAAQLGMLYAFLFLQTRLQWGVAAAHPPGLAFVTQALRALLLFIAGSAWLGLIGNELRSVKRRALLAAAVLVLAAGGGALPALGVVALLALFNRMAWIEGVSGWSRGVGCVISALLLVALSFVPVAVVSNGASAIQFSLAPSPPFSTLLSGTPAAAAARELALIRPLDRAVQAMVDVFRLQLVIVTIKLLFLPIRLSGMSLKRRFTINFLLVRSIPAFLSFVVFVTLAYLMLGHLKLTSARDQFERTLARAGTVAAAIADNPERSRGGGSNLTSIDSAVRWMGDDGARAAVVLRDSTGAIAASRGAPPALLAAGFAGAEHGDTRGVVPAGDSLYLGVRHEAEPYSAEVFVLLDSLYLARIMRPIGGDLRITAEPHVFVGSSGLRFDGSHAWTAHRSQVRAMEPGRWAGRRWFLARTYLPVGDWTRPIPGTERGALELYLETTPASLVRGAGRALPGLYANAVTLLLVIVAGFVISMVERFAVRSGRSIIQAVLDEMTALRRAAERFGAGDLDYRLPVQGKDEFSVVATSFNDMAANLKRQQQELVAKERLEQDLAVARGIQQRFLPQQTPSLEGLDVAGVSVPSREVGGDLFYWFTHADGSLGFTLGDVSGKSVSAALLMSNVLAALRAQAIDRVEIAESLARVNRLIVDQIEPGRFVTLFYGEADARSGSLRYVSAGHNPPLLMRSSGMMEWLREGGVPLGVLPAARYATAGVRFEPGDTLVVYSDGVTEAEGPSAAGSSAGSASPERFGEGRLAAVVSAQRGKPARAIMDAVLHAVHAFGNGTPQADDITLIVVRRV